MRKSKHNEFGQSCCMSNYLPVIRSIIALVLCNDYSNDIVSIITIACSEFTLQLQQNDRLLVIRLNVQHRPLLIRVNVQLQTRACLLLPVGT
jgi:hypothetical protein